MPGDGGGSQVLRETDLSGNLVNDYVYFGGRLMARVRAPDGAAFHYFPDALGSSRVIVQNNTATACYDSDFYPLGGERTVTNTRARVAHTFRRLNVCGL